MKIKKSGVTIGFFIFAAIFAFVIDISLQIFFEKQFLYCVLMCAILNMVTHENFLKIIFLTLLLCAESLFFTGTSWLPLIYMPPIIIGLHYAKQRLDGGRAFPVLLLAAAILICVSVTALWTWTLPPILYTIGALCVNLMIIGIGSLKFNTLSEQDNRL